MTGPGNSDEGRNLLEEELCALGEEPPSDEERALGEPGAVWSPGEGPEADPAGSEAAFLLRASTRLDWTDERHARGRQELLEAAWKHRGKAGRGGASIRWWQKPWLLLPLPALAALALFLGVEAEKSGEPVQEMDRTYAAPRLAADAGDHGSGSAARAQPTRAGGAREVAARSPDVDLIEAQLAAVEARLQGAAASSAEARLDEATRHYRARLLVQLEREGR